MNKFLILGVAIILAIIGFFVVKSNSQNQVSGGNVQTPNASQISQVKQAFPAAYPFPADSHIKKVIIDSPREGNVIFTITYTSDQPASVLIDQYKTVFEAEGYRVNILTLGPDNLQLVGYRSDRASGSSETVDIITSEESDVTGVIANISKAR